MAVEKVIFELVIDGLSQLNDTKSAMAALIDLQNQYLTNGKADLSTLIDSRKKVNAELKIELGSIKALQNENETLRILQTRTADPTLRAEYTKQINENVAAIKQMNVASNEQIGIIASLRQTIRDLKIARDASNDTVAIANYNKKIEESTEQMNRLTGATNQFKGSNGFWQDLKMQMIAAFGIYQVVEFGKELGASVIKLTAYRTALENVSKSNKDYENGMKLLSRLSNDYGQDVVSLTKSYTSFIAASNNSGLSLKERQRIYESIIKSGSALKLSNDEIQGSLLAVSQMFSKGTVQAEELRGQLGERLPGAFSLASKAMGVNESELGKLMKKGEIMASDLMPRLATELEKLYGDKAKNNIETVGGAWNRLTSRMIEYLTASNETNGVTTKTANVINYFANNLEEAVTILGIAAKSMIFYGIATQGATVWQTAASVGQTAWNVVTAIGIGLKTSFMNALNLLRGSLVTTTVAEEAATVATLELNAAMRANAIGFIIAGLFAAYEAFQYFNRESIKAKENQEALNKKIVDAQEPIRKQKTEFDELGKTLNDVNGKHIDQIAALDKMKTMYPEQFKGINTVKEAQSKWGAIIRGVTNDIANQIKMMDIQVRAMMNKESIEKNLRNKALTEMAAEKASTTSYVVPGFGFYIESEKEKLQKRVKSYEDANKKIQVELDKGLEMFKKNGGDVADILGTNEDKQLEPIKKGNGKKEKAKKEHHENLAVLDLSAQKAEIERMTDSQNKELALEQNRYASEIAKARVRITNKTELAKALEDLSEKHRQNDLAINLKWDILEVQQQKKLNDETLKFIMDTNKLKEDAAKLLAEHELKTKRELELATSEIEATRIVNQQDADRKAYEAKNGYIVSELELEQRAAQKKIDIQIQTQTIIYEKNKKFADQDLQAIKNAAQSEINLKEMQNTVLQTELETADVKQQDEIKSNIAFNLLQIQKSKNDIQAAEIKHTDEVAKITKTRVDTVNAIQTKGLEEGAKIADNYRKDEIRKQQEDEAKKLMLFELYLKSMQAAAVDLANAFKVFSDAGSKATANMLTNISRDFGQLAVQFRQFNKMAKESQKTYLKDLEEAGTDEKKLKKVAADSNDRDLNLTLQKVAAFGAAAKMAIGAIGEMQVAAQQKVIDNLAQEQQKLTTAYNAQTKLLTDTVNHQKAVTTAASDKQKQTVIDEANSKLATYASSKDAATKIIEQEKSDELLINQQYAASVNSTDQAIKDAAIKTITDLVTAKKQKLNTDLANLTTNSAATTALTNDTNAKLTAADAQLNADIYNQDNKAKQDQLDADKKYKIAVYENTKKQMDAEYKMKVAQFNMNKEIALAQIAVSTAMAVMMTMEEGGFFASPLAMIVAGMGLFEAGLVISQKPPAEPPYPPAPTFRVGTDDTSKYFGNSSYKTDGKDGIMSVIHRNEMILNSTEMDELTKLNGGKRPTRKDLIVDYSLIKKEREAMIYKPVVPRYINTTDVERNIRLTVNMEIQKQTEQLKSEFRALNNTIKNKPNTSLTVTSTEVIEENSNLYGRKITKRRL